MNTSKGTTSKPPPKSTNPARKQKQSTSRPCSMPCARKTRRSSKRKKQAGCLMERIDFRRFLDSTANNDGHRVALDSHVRSGSTFIRRLLENVTGIYTGSNFMMTNATIYQPDAGDEGRIAHRWSRLDDKKCQNVYCHEKSASTKRLKRFRRQLLK